MAELPYISYNNHLVEDSPTVSARSEETTYPASNLTKASVVDLYRSSDMALQLNGTDEYAYHADDPDLDITGDLTIEVLIKPASATGTQILLDKLDGNDGYGLHFVYGELRAFIYDQSGSGDQCYVTTTAAGLVIDTWYRIKMVYDASAAEISIYINGVEEARANNATQTGCTLWGTIPTSISANSTRLTIGASNGGTNQFTGQIDFIGLDDAEHDNGGYLAPTICQGYWNFDDSDLTDSSGNDHTLTGAGLDESNWVPCAAYHWVYAEFSESVLPTLLFFDRRHNLTSDATLRLLRGSPFDSYDSVATPSVSAGKAIVETLSSTASTGWWIEIHDPGNPDGYIEIPHLWLGEWQDLSTSFAEYSERDEIPVQVVESSIGTRRRYQVGSRHKAWSLPWELKSADVAIWRATQPYAVLKPIALCLDRGDGDDNTYLVDWLNAGSFGRSIQIQTDDRSEAAEPAFEFAEVGAGIDQ